MNRSTRDHAAVMFFVVAILMTGGCAGLQENPYIEQARLALTSTQSDAIVVKNVPLELQKAIVAFEEAENSWKAEASDRVIEHLAYLARQKAAIAREVASMKETERYIETMSAERNQVLLEARTKEAERALKKAEEQRKAAERALLEAENARMEATAAAERAKKLEAEIAELQAAQSERGLVVTLGDVLFDVNKSDLKSGAYVTMDKLAAFLAEHQKRNVQIEGFTDNTGSDEHNQRLSEQRAEAVRNALVYRGIASSRVWVRGYGEAFPVTTNNTPEGLQRNRRVEIIISDDKGIIPDRRY